MRTRDELRSHSGFVRDPAASSVAVSALGVMVAPHIIERNLLRPYWLVRQRRVRHHHHLRLHPRRFRPPAVQFADVVFLRPALERSIGTPRFLALYFVGARRSAASARSTSSATIPTTPRSARPGAILAVLFAYIVYYPKQMLYLFFAIPIPAVLFAFGYLAYTIVGVEEPRGQHQSRCASGWRIHRPGVRGHHRLPGLAPTPAPGRVRLPDDAQNHE